ncbi:ABC transporter permease [Gordonia caeni]|uniref:ABC transporter permease n=1 Tax=Gordonia caeni TaxID=1007097 RepID=A0ABP7NNT4_9ACTN
MRPAWLRAAWSLLGLLAVAGAVWVANQPVSSVSMSCGKSGDLWLDGAPHGADCSDSIVSVIGYGPPVALGLLLAVPPLLAAAAMRRWVSCLAVALLVILTFVGLTRWSDFWGYLLGAFPLATGAAVLAALSIGSPRRSPGRAGSAVE